MKHKNHEIDRMMKFFGPEPKGLHDILERQFTVLMTRAQVLLGLTGVVITTTGFSGRVIAGTNLWAQLLIISGIGLTLAAASIVVFGVLPLKWLTQQPGDSVEAWLAESMRYRDCKLRHYRKSVVLLLAGLVLYVGALALMLINPEKDAVDSARERSPISLHLERHDSLLHHINQPEVCQLELRDHRQG